VEGIIPQMKAQPGMPVRQAVQRRKNRVREIMHTLPHAAQAAIRESLDQNDETMVMSYNSGQQLGAGDQGNDFPGSDYDTMQYPKV
jgi:phospholipid/cholesterol/gamma-HCH transport system ATP-binding protein